MFILCVIEGFFGSHVYTCMPLMLKYIPCLANDSNNNNNNNKRFQTFIVLVLLLVVLVRLGQTYLFLEFRYAFSFSNVTAQKVRRIYCY